MVSGQSRPAHATIDPCLRPIHGLYLFSSNLGETSILAPAFLGDESLKSIGNGLRKFLWRSLDSKPALCTFARICVEMDFSKGFSAKIILQDKDYSRTQILDYENLSFRCRNCFETWHLARSCGKQLGKKRSSKIQRPTWCMGAP